MTLSALAAAAEAPERVALIGPHHVLTYRELAERVRIALAWLAGRGVRHGSGPVALPGTNDVGSSVMLHALLVLGVPALLIHPRLVQREREELLRVAGATFFVEDARLALDTSLAHGMSHLPDPAPIADDEATLAIVQTSGTSGRPRAVRLSRRAFVASARASQQNIGWQSDDRWLLTLPTAHVGGLSIITRCLLARRTVVTAGSTQFDERALARTLADQRITLCSLVPTQLARLLELDPPWRPAPSLRAVLIGGAAATVALLEQARKRAVPVLTSYGMTETCSQVATQSYGTLCGAEHGAGRPLSGVAIRIAVDGQIEVAGPVLASGMMPPSEILPMTRDGFLKTGDLGHFDASGCLHVIGRTDELIVTGGENVHPADIERALERCPGVRAVCVFPLPDATWGTLVAAALVASCDFDRARFAQHVRAELASFKRPRRIALLDELPTSAAGKTDRALTAKLAISRLEPI